MSDTEILNEILNKIELFTYIYLFFNISNLSFKKIRNLINGVGR